MDTVEEIKKLIKDKRLVYGAERTIKNLRMGKCTRIWFSANVPQDAKEDIERYARLGNVPIEQLSIPNDELGLICKKQFSVSLLSFSKD